MSSAVTADQWYIVPNLSTRPKLTHGQESGNLVQEKRMRIITRLHNNEDDKADKPKK